MILELQSQCLVPSTHYSASFLTHMVLVSIGCGWHSTNVGRQGHLPKRKSSSLPSPRNPSTYQHLRVVAFPDASPHWKNLAHAHCPVRHSVVSDLRACFLNISRKWKFLTFCPGHCENLPYRNTKKKIINPKNLSVCPSVSVSLSLSSIWLYVSLSPSSLCLFVFLCLCFSYLCLSVSLSLSSIWLYVPLSLSSQSLSLSLCVSVSLSLWSLSLSLSLCLSDPFVSFFVSLCLCHLSSLSMSLFVSVFLSLSHGPLSFSFPSTLSHFPLHPLRLLNHCV